MKYFEDVISEDEIKEIKKRDNLYTKNVISLDDKKNRKFLNRYSYETYLRKMNNENSEDNKGGGSCE